MAAVSARSRSSRVSAVPSTLPQATFLPEARAKASRVNKNRPDSTAVAEALRELQWKRARASKKGAKVPIPTAQELSAHHIQSINEKQARKAQEVELSFRQIQEQERALQMAMSFERTQMSAKQEQAQAVAREQLAQAAEKAARDKQEREKDTRVQKWDFRSQQEIEADRTKLAMTNKKELERQIAERQATLLAQRGNTPLAAETSLVVDSMNKEEPVLSRFNNASHSSLGALQRSGSSMALALGAKDKGMSMSQSMNSMYVTKPKISSRDLLTCTAEELQASKKYPVFLQPQRPPSRSRARGGLTEQLSSTAIQQSFLQVWFHEYSPSYRSILSPFIEKKAPAELRPGLCCCHSHSCGIFAFHAIRYHCSFLALACLRWREMWTGLRS